MRRHNKLSRFLCPVHVMLVLSYLYYARVLQPWLYVNITKHLCRLLNRKNRNALLLYGTCLCFALTLSRFLAVMMHCNCIVHLCRWDDSRIVINLLTGFIVQMFTNIFGGRESSISAGPPSFLYCVIVIASRPRASVKGVCLGMFAIQIKYGLPYCVTCPSMSTNPGSLIAQVLENCLHTSSWHSVSEGGSVNSSWKWRPVIMSTAHNPLLLQLPILLHSMTPADI